MDFTKLLNRGHKRYIDKYIKPRKLGRCDGCQSYGLLIKHTDPIEDFDWELCNRCYDLLTFGEK